MSFVNFIDFNTDKDAALSKRTSPVIQFNIYTGIQLLPNNAYPYIQTTNITGGIELEDWAVYVVDLCTGEETDVTDYFIVERNFQDTSGQSQFDWSLTNVPYDFGNNLVYLKVQQLIGETFYSNAFQLTNNESEKTCRLDYKNNSEDTMQSIQVQMYFWQPLKKTEKGSYYEVSTRNTVTTVVKSQKFERWRTDFIPNDLMIKIDDVFENIYVYVNLVRSNLFEAIDIKEFENEENFKDNTVKISFFNTDTYNPLTTEDPVVLIPSINLLSVVTNSINAIYEFSYENFTPTYLTYQTSQDQINWTNNTSGVISPKSIVFNGTGTWYFRIIHPEAQSNVIQLDLGSDVLANDDNVSIARSENIDIYPLVNDVLVGETLITNVSVANSGAVQIMGGGTYLRYSHGGGAGASDSFTYTISNGITQSTATVNITVNISTEVQISQSASTASAACGLPLTLSVWILEVGSIPEVGDLVYINPELTETYKTSGNLWFKIPDNKVMQLNSVGRILKIQNC